MTATETRIDKYLWAIRVFKTRSDASDACKSGKIKINDIEAKASKNVKEGDLISVRKGSIHYSYRVLAPIENRQPAAKVSLYAEDLTPEEEKNKLNAPVETIFMKRERGSGRPTKKERRTIDRLLDK